MINLGQAKEIAKLWDGENRNNMYVFSRNGKINNIANMLEEIKDCEEYACTKESKKQLSDLRNFVLVQDSGDEDKLPICPSCYKCDCSSVGLDDDSTEEFRYEKYICNYCGSSFQRKYIFCETVPVKLIAPRMERLNILGTVYVEREIAMLLNPGIDWDFLEQFCYWLNNGTRILPENWLNAVIDGSYKKLETSKTRLPIMNAVFCSVCGKLVLDSFPYDSVTCLPLCDRHAGMSELGTSMKILGDSDFFKTNGTYLLTNLDKTWFDRDHDGEICFYGFAESALDGLEPDDDESRAVRVIDCPVDVQMEYIRKILKTNMQGNL